MKCRRQVVVALLGLSATTLWAATVNVGGEYTNPNSTIGSANSANMTNDTTFGWQTGTCIIPVKNNGFIFSIDSGNGNGLEYGGAISGTGTVRLLAGPWNYPPQWTTDNPIRLTGAQPNTVTGTWYAAKGRLQLEKSNGVTAISGNVVVGGQGDNDGLYWMANDQIVDTASITLLDSSHGGAYLNLNGHTETVASLTLVTTARVDTGAGGVLTAAHLTLGGVAMPAGVYDSGSASWVTGTGRVIIGSADQAPAAPLNLQATDGTYTDRVQVRWDAAAFADSYQLYRNTINNSGTAVPLGGVLTTNAYTDSTVVFGQTYYYWVTASNSHGTSPFSAADSGFVAAIAAPVGLLASDGTYYDHVALTWTAVPGADSYEVYRSATSSSGTAVLLAGNLVVPSYGDSNVVQEQVYYYWVKARAGANTSGFSAPDTGFAQVSGGPFFNIGGEVTNPNATIPAGYAARCTNDAYFGWQTATCAINVYNAGYSFGIDSGGGNGLNYSGAISGAGEVYYVGAPQGSLLEVPIILSGANSNSYSGVTRIKRGYVLAARNSGVRTIPGDVVLGGTDKAVLKFGATGQIGSSARITTTGTLACGIEPNGFNVTLGVWDMQAPSFIDFRATSASVHLADSHEVAWNLTKEFQIFNWKGSAQTPVCFGTSAAGLSAAQLAQVGFQNPAGFPAGLYRAVLSATGEVMPGTKVEPINPPFDVSAAAQADRQAIYTSNGRTNLSGLGTPLTNNTRIVFFGDSITWQNVYLSKIQSALNTGAGTAARGITCINRGINGGGVVQVRDGSTDSAYPGSSPQASFASLLASDQASIAVVFIGINDVWWRNTSTNTFDQALRNLAASASSAGVRLVLATLTVHYELPDGTNPDDPAIEVFAQITRQVAADTHATLVDLRRVYIAYLQNYNWQLNLNGSLSFQTSGVLTYDGVHPTEAGNNLLADHIAQGIYNALASSPPTPGNLTATPANLLVSLKWDGATNATGYALKRSLASGGPFLVIGGTSGASGTNYTDTQVTNGVVYWYVVSATNASGASASSAAISARPLPATAPAAVFLTGTGNNSPLSLDLLTGATLRFNAMGGIQYWVSYTEDLQSGVWMSLSGQVCTNNGTGTMVLVDPAPPTRPQRFYRIGSQKP